MKIGSIGYDHSHDERFVMDFEDGLECWLFLIVKTTAKFVIGKEKMQAEPGTILLLEPGTPCKYCAKDKVYTDDWFFAETEETDKAYLLERKIPTNTLLHLGQTAELSSLMHRMSLEHYSVGIYREEIEKNYLEILFDTISRSIQTKVFVMPQSFLKKNQKLTRIRMEIYAQPEQICTVDELAQRAGFSRSGLQHLYKKLFGVSITQDMVQSRMDCAKRLLSTTTLSVHDIAIKCGYRNAYYFMKQFKKHLQMTPTEYRRSVSSV